MSIAYASFVDARARDLNGNVEAALDEVDDELGIRLHWRKQAARDRGLLDQAGRVEHLRGRTIVVDAPERTGPLPGPVVESRADRPPPVRRRT